MRLESLPDFWSRMPLNVHPQDKWFLKHHQDHGFNLDYPPPAFIGDILNARVVILLNNGLYDKAATSAEFPDTATQIAYRTRLEQPQPIDERFTAPYYLNKNYTEWLKDGSAAIVNAVAYRSVDIKAPAVKRLSKILPSAVFHRKWLHEALWPEVLAERRFVVVHRWSLWNNTDKIFHDCKNAVGWQAAKSPNLTRDEYLAASRFLKEHGA